MQQVTTHHACSQKRFQTTRIFFIIAIMITTTLTVLDASGQANGMVGQVSLLDTTPAFYIESVNNSWLNENLSSRLSRKIDRILARTYGNDTKLVLMNPNDHQLISINASFQIVMNDLLESVLTSKGNNSISMSFGDIPTWTFYSNVALTNGTGFEVAFSSESRIIGIAKGQWNEKESKEYGIDEITFTFEQQLSFYEISSRKTREISSLLETMITLIFNGLNEESQGHESTVPPENQSIIGKPMNLLLFLRIFLSTPSPVVSILVVIGFAVIFYLQRKSRLLTTILEKILEIIDLIQMNISLLITGIIGYLYHAQWHERLRKEDLLENEHRVMIMRILKIQKMAHFQYLKRMVGCSTSVLLWHLNVLENFGLIKKIRKDKYLIYHSSEKPPTRDELHVYLACLNERARKILLTITTYNYLSIRDLTMITNIKESTIRYHAKKLVRLGILEELLTSKGRLFKVSTKYHQLLRNTLKQWTF